MRVYGRIAHCAEVKCPHCGTARWWPLSTLREQLKRDNFNGQCRSCGQSQARAGYFKWAKRSGLERRNINHAGYVLLGPTAIPSEDLPMFRIMQTRNHAVFEHRWVMAKVLGRPLNSRECVDHMDGNKTNNDATNLRLYLRGKNQQGSANGYGTYYHELQVALARVRVLEYELERLKLQAGATTSS